MSSTKGLSVKKGGHDPAGLAARILAYFDANPDEELTARDIQVKFNVVNLGVVYNRLTEMARKGEIDYEPRMVRVRKAKG